MAAFIIFRMTLLGSMVVNSCNLSTWERREEDSRVKSKNKTPPMDSTQRETTVKEEPGELVQALCSQNSGVWQGKKFKVIPS